MHRTLPKPELLSLMLVGLLLTAGVSGCGNSETAGGADTSASDAEAAIASSAKASVRKVRDNEPNRYAATASAPPRVRIETSLGPIEIRLDPEHAPITVQNFLNYVQSGHYAQTIFHYMEQGELVLGGGVAPDGTPRPTGMAIRNEAHNGRKNKRGTVAMARDAAVIDSATSQFFINLQDAPQRDHSGETPEQYGYCVFGDVTEGLDVVEKISAIPMETRNVDGEQVQVPARTVRIESVQVLR